VKVADVIIKANTPIADLRAALITVAGAGHEISANRLAAFLSRYADRPMEGFKFTSRKAHAGTKLWQLQA
jgi:hypothetical protein